MDLLGSIMSSMDKPPSLSEKERQQIKKRKEELQRRQNEQKEHCEKFKQRVEADIVKHFDDLKNVELKFDPMDKVHRMMVHEAAESAGFISYAFGEDGLDRYVHVYRRDNAPCEDELLVRRRGEPWNEEVKQQLIESREREQQNKEENKRKRKPEKIVPNSNYKDKYAHLIGSDAALDAAKRTDANKSYGFVPSDLKKDNRSIEQMMADIKAKRQRTGDKE